MNGPVHASLLHYLVTFFPVHGQNQCYLQPSLLASPSLSMVTHVGHPHWSHAAKKSPGHEDDVIDTDMSRVGCHSENGSHTSKASLQALPPKKTSVRKGVGGAHWQCPLGAVQDGGTLGWEAFHVCGQSWPMRWMLGASQLGALAGGFTAVPPLAPVMLIKAPLRGFGLPHSCASREAT